MDVYRDRSESLSSHHFLVNANLHIDIPKTERRELNSRRDISACHDPNIALNFADEVAHWMDQLNNCELIDWITLNRLNHL